MHISSNMSITDDVLLCSDEVAMGCRAGSYWSEAVFWSTNTISGHQPGQVPGLVAVKVELITDLEFQTSYISLHAFLKDLGLQWIARNRAVRILPQALLRRSLLSNPSVLAISTHNQRNPFTESQLLELENITRRGAAPWLHPEGIIGRGLRPGSFELKRITQPEDKVSVIIPFRDQADLTRLCISSLLKHEKSIPFEIILVDNGSTQIEAIELADSFSNTAQLHDVDLISLRDESPFNFSALNNRARR